MKKLIALLAVLLLLVGCATVKEGRVVELRHEEERQWDTLDPVCTVYGSNGECEFHIYINNHHVDDEDWIVVIRGRGQYGTLDVETAYSVTKTTWYELGLGDWFVAADSAIGD